MNRDCSILLNDNLRKELSIVLHATLLSEEIKQNWHHITQLCIWSKTHEAKLQMIKNVEIEMQQAKSQLRLVATIF